MSWRLGKSLVMTLLTTGCLSQTSASDRPGWPDGPNAVSLLGGEVVIDAPDGYCLDQTATLADGPAQTVFFAACGPGYPHVAMTAVVAQGRTAGILSPDGTAALARFFATERGLSSLSRSGRAGTVTIQSSEVGESIVVLHLTDTSPSAQTGLAQRYVRAVTELNGHLVTFSVLPFTDRGMPDATVRDLLDRLVAASSAASRLSAESQSE